MRLTHQKQHFVVALKLAIIAAKFIAKPYSIFLSYIEGALYDTQTYQCDSKGLCFTLQKIYIAMTNKTQLGVFHYHLLRLNVLKNVTFTFSDN